MQITVPLELLTVLKKDALSKYYRTYSKKLNKLTKTTSQMKGQKLTLLHQ